MVRAYVFAVRWRKRALLGLSATFDGVWLGLFDDDTLTRVDEAFYARTESALGNDIAYADPAWVGRGLHDWEREAIDRHFPERARIVVTGAGGGREVLALLEMGHDAVGYEPHAGLAASGARLLADRGHPGRLHASPRDAWPAGAERCDGVVVGWGSYTLIQGRATRVAFLRGAAQALEEGGPLLVSFFNRAGNERYLAQVHRVARVVRRLRRAEPPEPGDALGPNFAHSVSRQELEDELRDGGFEPVHFAAQPYGHAVGRAVSR